MHSSHTLLPLPLLLICFLCSRQSLMEHMVDRGDKQAQILGIRDDPGCFCPPTALLVSVRPGW